MNLDDIKKAQLKEAMALDEMGIDPDKIMVTLSPEEYAQMHKGPDAAPAHDPHEHDPVELSGLIIGDINAAGKVNISKSSFARGFQPSEVDEYLDRIALELDKIDGYKHEDQILQAQLYIFEGLSAAVVAVLESLKDELKDFEDLIRTTQGYQAQIELEEDRRTTYRITSRVDTTYRRMQEMQKQISAKLDPGMGTR